MSDKKAERNALIVYLATCRNGDRPRYTYEEIGYQFGLTRERVRQIARRGGEPPRREAP